MGKLQQIGILKFLSKYIKNHKCSFALAFVFLCVSSSMVMLMGWRVRAFIDYGMLSGNSEELFRQMLIFVGIAALMIVTGFFRYFFINQGGERVIQDLRNDLFIHAISLSIDKLDKLRNADILSRMTSDIQTLQHFLSGSVSVAVRNFFMVIGCVIMLIVTSHVLSFYFIMTVPPIIFVFKIFGRKIKKLSRGVQERLARIVEFTEETIYGIAIVQAFTHEEKNKQVFGEKNLESANFAIGRAKIRALLLASISVLIFCAVGFILYSGGKSVMQGKLSAGQFSSFIFYAMTMGTSFSMFAEVVGNFHSVAGALSRVIDLFSMQTSVQDDPEAISMNDFQDKIIFDKVNFHYPNRTMLPVLQDFSLEIKKGEKVALVGLSGAGKSTVFKLLLRFYDVFSGSIKIDGIELKKIKIKDLRQLFSYVSQDSQLFSGTARENILYGNMQASEAEIAEAVSIANVAEFMERLPQGLDTHIGEKGFALSGGQKQRIAIARAIIKKPKIILFDEATSALDTENEKMVQEAFDNISKNHTAIVIAHRLSTVRNSDKIVVIDAGQIKEIGTHQKLLAKENGIYQKLIKMQFDKLD